MILKGETNTATIFTDNVESACLDQIRNMMKYPSFSKPIRIMPDCHAGKGSVIGFTMPVDEGIVPNVVGVDIGCGVLAYNLGNTTVDLNKLDTFIHSNIPSGFKRFNSNRIHNDEYMDKLLHCIRATFDMQIARESLGTLGGGNHFISIEQSESTGNNYLIVHSGSRHLGVEVAAYWQKKAIADKEHNDGVPDDLCALYGIDKEYYLSDMHRCQFYAGRNRLNIMSDIFVHFCKNHEPEIIESVHNYIEDDIIRKGAISAYKDEPCIIPLNMRDGSLIGIGKGNPDWNYSAPHGAGRLMSRSKAKKTVSLKEYRESMQGIFTTCVNEHTLDESPMAYKNGKEIENLLSSTVDIVDHLKPIYNFKAN